MISTSHSCFCERNKIILIPILFPLAIITLVPVTNFVNVIIELLILQCYNTYCSASVLKYYLLCYCHSANIPKLPVSSALLN